MIKISKAKNESRKRDEKRQRLVLQVGKHSWHITKEEAKQLIIKIKKVII